MPKELGLYNFTESVALLSEPGFDIKKAETQLLGFIKRGLIHPTARASEGKTSARFYDEAAVATAKVLSELTLMQIADRDLMGAAAESIHMTVDETAALSMGAWTAPDGYNSWTIEKQTEYVKSYPAKTPMHYGLHLWRAGFWPLFEFRFMRHDRTGERKAVGAIYDNQVSRPAFPPESTGWIPRGSIIISLVPLFKGLFEERQKRN